jgi:opacity protein-like surface antigen
MKRITLSAAALLVASSSLAHAADKLYISGYLGLPPSDLEASSDYAGASGYLSPTSPTGRMGDLETDEKATYGFAFGYKINENLRLELSYADFDYGTTSWGVDFNSFNGTFNPVNATPFVGRLSSKAYFLGLGYEKDFAEDWSWKLGAAIGLARNKFHSADEGSYAEVSSNTQSEFAYRLSAGLGYKLTEKVKLTATAGLVDIGGFESAKERVLTNGSTEAITPYKFETDLQPELTLGTSFTF